MKDKKKYILILVLTSVLWSTGGTLIKLMSWNSFAVAGIRSLIAAITVLLITRKFTFRLDKYQWMGALFYAASVILIVTANKYTTVANAVLLTYTSPIYTAIGGYFILKEKVRKMDIASIAVILLGLVLFVADGLGAGHVFGNVIALFAGVTFGLMIVFLRKSRENSPCLNMIWGNIIAFVICIPFMGKVDVNTRDVGLILVLGVVQLGISYAMYSYAIQGVTALEANVITILEPILGPVWALLFYREMPSKMALLGGLVILFGILLKEIKIPDRKQRKEGLSDVL